MSIELKLTLTGEIVAVQPPSRPGGPQTEVRIAEGDKGMKQLWAILSRQRLAEQRGEATYKVGTPEAPTQYQLDKVQRYTPAGKQEVTLASLGLE